MRVQLCILLLVVLFGLFALASSSEAEQDAAREEKGAIRRSFNMPKLFSMEVYMEKFEKKYPNAAELMRRTKLFMARAFSVFVSSIKYLYSRSSKYLKISPFSDWTKAERDATLNYEGKRPEYVEDLPEPAVDPEDLRDMFEDADVGEMVAELEPNDRKRAKRQVGPAKTRKLSVEQLIGGDESEPELSPKYAPYVESNNPAYEQPEMFSEGADDEQSESELLSKAETEKIDSAASQGGYLSSIFSGGTKQAGSNSTSWGTKLKLLINGVRQEDEELLEGMDTSKRDKDSPDQLFLDYRDSGCILPPKNQKRCGSCYIFAQTAILEYHHCKQTGKLVPFSEQYVVDCGPGRGIDHLRGCIGGIESYVGDFYAEYGLELSVDYPYRAKAQKCPYNPSMSPEHMGHTRMDLVEHVVFDIECQPAAALTANEITHLLEVKGPLTISIKVEEDFHDFGGGVDHNNCSPGARLGHAMVIVGHGIEDGTEYFLMRNSYGTDFGIGGYYKMAKRGRPGCLLRIGYTRAKFAENSDHRGKEILKRRNRLINRLLPF